MSNQKKEQLVGKNTRVQDIEKKFDVDLGVSPRMKLTTYLREKGFQPLAEMIEK